MLIFAWKTALVFGVADSESGGKVTKLEIAEQFAVQESLILLLLERSPHNLFVILYFVILTPGS